MPGGGQQVVAPAFIVQGEVGPLVHLDDEASREQLLD